MGKEKKSRAWLERNVVGYTMFAVKGHHTMQMYIRGARTERAAKESYEARAYGKRGYELSFVPDLRVPK